MIRRIRGTIKARIFGGYALMLALAMGLAWNGWHALEQFAGSVDVATSAQRLSDRIQTMALEVTRAVNASGAVNFAAARNSLAEVRARYGELAAELADDAIEAGSGVEAGSDVGTLAGFADAMDARMAAYVEQDGKRTALVDAQLKIFADLREVADAIVTAQDDQLKAAGDAVDKARADQKAGTVAIDLADDLVQQVLKLQLAEAGGGAEAVRAALDPVRSTFELVAARLPAGAKPAGERQTALAAYEAALKAGGAPPARSAALLAAANDMRQAMRNRQVEFETQMSAAQDTLNAAIALRNAAALVQTLTQEARATQLALLADPTKEAVAAMDAVALRIENAARDLSYSIEDPTKRKVVADLRAQIKAHRPELPVLARALTATHELAAAVSAEAADAVVVAGRIGDRRLKHIDSQRVGASRALAIGTLLALLVGGVLSVVIGRGITVPLARIVDVMRRLAQGDLAVEIPGRERKDELRDVADAVAVFRDNAAAMARMTAERDQAKRQAEIEKRQAVLALADEFEQSVGSVVNSVNQAALAMRNVATSLTATADVNQNEARAAVSGASEALVNSQTVASAAEQLAASVAEIGGQVARSADTAAQAAEQASQTNESFASLSRAGERIAEFIDLIKGLARQTNLLALNATIEAARAGEAGRGFSVVAAEVKKLAEETARASDEITAQIEAIRSATQTSAEAMRSITTVIDRVKESSAAIAAGIEEQEAVTATIAESIHHVSARTGTVSSNIERVSDAAGKTGSAAASVLSTASSLVRDADALQRNVHDFVTRLRAG